MKESKLKKILVTGASGFIGKACLRLLHAENFEIHAFSSKEQKSQFKNVFWYEVDLFNTARVYALCNEIKAECLLHLAWDVSDKEYDNEKHFDWVKVGLDLIKAFAQNGGKRVVGVGTCVEYDWSYKNCSEKDPLKPKNAYGKAKQKLQEELKVYATLNKLSFAWGRIFFVYGPNENSRNLIPYIIRNFKNNQVVEIKKGNAIRDYIFIDDVAEALVHLIKSDIQGVVNIASETPVRIKDIVEYIAKYFNKMSLVKIEESLNEVDSCIVGKNSRLQRESDWKPKVNLEQGLKKTIQFLEK